MLEIPLRKSNGTKTAMCVRIEARIAVQTSSAPSTAACMRGFFSSSMCRNVFSSTTIDASTIMPTPSARPPNVIVFNVNPEKYRRANVPTIEIGIDVQMITVDRRFRRKRKMMATTSRAPT